LDYVIVEVVWIDGYTKDRQRSEDMMVTAEEIGRHGSKHSCWVVIKGKAYDVTDFLDHHPGGSSSILRYAGKARKTRQTLVSSS
jgi:cytochrome b involved in lipid metabolism